jgi:hypothetical protein
MQMNLRNGGEQKNCSARRCPQGGMLLPLLWSLVVDDLLSGLNSNGYYTVGYAGDIATLINRKFLHIVSEVLQTALCRVQQLCIRMKLSINPNMTVVIPFTRKRKIKGLKEPILSSKRIQISSEVKYLGITLDKGLIWKNKLDKIINKIYKAFWTSRGTFRKTSVLKPKVIYWIYTEVVRSIFTKAATVWGPRFKLHRSQANLANSKECPAWELKEQ